MDSMHNPLAELSPCVRIFIESLLAEAEAIDSARPAKLDSSNHDSSNQWSSNQRSSNPRARRNVLASGVPLVATGSASHSCLCTRHGGER
jgi:hypothetical protein